MSVCCVSGCKSRHSSTSKLKFFRIPSEYRPFQANRRRLWLKAIQQVNGSTEGLNKNARICGAHFKSGEASMDHKNPDFVPSVFQCMNPNPTTKKKVKRTYGRRKKWHWKAKVNNVKETNSHLNGQLSEMQTTASSSVEQDEETLTDRDESEINLQTIPTPNKASEMTQKSKGTSKPPSMLPTVRLRSVFAPLIGYMCELCSQKFSHASELVKHKQLHENSVSCDVSGKVSTEQEEPPKHVPEPSFPCNICDRSFTTNQSLKRHKLLHVKDGRRCPKCGLIFCQLHNHVLFMPLTKNEQDSTTDESLLQDSEVNNGLSSDESELEKSESFTDESESKQNFCKDASLLDEPGHESEASAAESAVVIKPGPSRETQNPLPPASHLKTPRELPLPKLKRLLSPHMSKYVVIKLGPSHETQNPLPPASHLMIPKEIPLPKLKRPLSSQISRYFRDDYSTDYVQLHLPQKPQLEPHLKIFSPQRLTSALLKVNRNYDYILSKPGNLNKCKDQRTAYDLEIVL